jgi:hypothetical protein
MVRSRARRPPARLPAAPLAALLVALAPLVPVATAEARTADQFAYPADKVWNASLRLLRIDLGCRLGERDAEVGYLTFDYVDGGRAHAGAVELVPMRVDGREGVRVVISIPAMPSYVERMILDRLGRKLVEDFGEPLPPPARPEPPAAGPEDGAQGSGANRGGAGPGAGAARPGGAGAPEDRRAAPTRDRRAAAPAPGAR